MNIVRCIFSLVIGCIVVIAPHSSAQVPDTLKHSISAPPTGAQNGAELGYSVAVDGAYAVVGAPYDDTRRTDAGVVKVFSTTTGELLHVLTHPEPGQDDRFGNSVAISGSRVVVGAYFDDYSEADSGTAYVFDLASETPTVPVATLHDPIPGPGEAFGCSVSISGPWVVVGAYGDVVSATAAGRAYVYNLDFGTPGYPVTTIDNPTPAANDRFGWSVAVSGALVVVGAPNDDRGAFDEGSAYVYDMVSATPSVPIATLFKASPIALDRFGFSVAISGSRVVVGVPNADADDTNTGSVMVYDLASATPTVPVAILENPTPSSGDFFGFSVAISGSRIVAGANQDNTGAGDAGSAYVYDLAGVTPTVPVATLNNPGPATGDEFGFSVAIAGTRVLVGAHLDDTGAANAGSAYVYDMGGATPTVPIATLIHTGPLVGDQFGQGVAISGAHLAVGAPFDDTGRNDAGIAYVYDLLSTTPAVPVITLNNPDPSDFDFFGWSMAMNGTRLVVGALDDTRTGGNGSGAFVYDLAGSNPTIPIATLNNADPQSLDRFGYSVAITDTLVVVGDPSGPAGKPEGGRAYVYDLKSGTPAVPMATLSNPVDASGGEFGSSVAIAGAHAVVVGAPREDAGGADAGAVYIFNLMSAGPMPSVMRLTIPNPTGFDNFGTSVAISGTRVAVGAPYHFSVTSDTGSVYVYDLASATPTVPVATLINPTPGTGDNFGNSVALSGTRLVVGALNDDGLTTRGGMAWVYELTSTTPTVPVAALYNPTPDDDDQYGTSVAIDGTAVAVGSPFSGDEGSAFIFGPVYNDNDGDGLLDLWEYARFGTTIGHGPLDDADGDGRVELFEQAFNSNPLVPNGSGLFPVANEAGYLTATITKRAGVNYLVQSAGTLNAGAFSDATTTVLLDNVTTLKVRDNVPMSTPGSRFMRVKVTATP